MGHDFAVIVSMKGKKKNIEGIPDEECSAEQKW